MASFSILAHLLGSGKLGSSPLLRKLSRLLVVSQRLVMLSHGGGILLGGAPWFLL